MKESSANEFIKVHPLARDSKDNSGDSRKGVIKSRRVETRM
jgi:hypothetical protein